MDQRDSYSSGQPLAVEPVSIVHGLIGTFVGALLLAITIWMGHAIHASGGGHDPLRVEDPNRAMVYMADVATGDVRVLNIRGGIAEVARFHHQQGVRSIELDPSRRRLLVYANDASYIYDTRRFALLERRVELARRSSIATTPN